MRLWAFSCEKCILLPTQRVEGVSYNLYRSDCPATKPCDQGGRSGMPDGFNRLDFDVRSNETHPACSMLCVVIDLAHFRYDAAMAPSIAVLEACSWTCGVILDLVLNSLS